MGKDSVEGRLLKGGTRRFGGPAADTDAGGYLVEEVIFRLMIPSRATNVEDFQNLGADPRALTLQKTYVFTPSSAPRSIARIVF